MELEESDASTVTFIEYETFEYEVEEEEEAELVEESKKLVEKLKELQTLVDEKIKECVPEGVYLEMMNHMCEMYKITNRIPPQTT